MQQCPACNYELTLAEQTAAEGKCPSCGIYFAKYKERLARQEAEAEAAREKAVAEAIKKAAKTPAQYYGGTQYCMQCGTVSNGKRHVPGSILIELVMWCCFLIPGLIYSIWRHSAQKKVCTQCKQPGLIPVMSPKAQKELKA
jgi:hypothetical protein